MAGYPNHAVHSQGCERFCLTPGRDWSPQDELAAFGWLATGCLDDFIRFAYARTGNLQDAQDVVADAFLDAWKYRRSYDPARYRGGRCPLKNWMFTNIARKAEKKGKQRRKRNEVPLQPSAGPGPAAADSSTLGRPTAADATVTWADFEPRLSRLKEREREAVDLCYRQGLSREEAGRRSRWPCNANAMKVRLSRSLQKIRR